MCCFDGIVNASISFRILIMHNNTKLRGMNDFICVYVVMIDGLQGVMNVAVRAQISILFKLDPACQRYCVKPHSRSRSFQRSVCCFWCVGCC